MKVLIKPTLDVMFLGSNAIILIVHSRKQPFIFFAFPQNLTSHYPHARIFSFTSRKTNINNSQCHHTVIIGQLNDSNVTATC